MDVGAGSLALCHNMSSPFQFCHLCVLLFGGLKPPYSEWVVHRPATPASHGSVLQMQTPSPLQTCQGPQLVPLLTQFEMPWDQVQTQA